MTIWQEKNYKGHNTLSVVIGLTCFLIPVHLNADCCGADWQCYCFIFRLSTLVAWEAGRKSMWLFPVSFLSLTGSCFTCCIWSLPHVCIWEYLSLCVFLSNEFLPLNKIAFDWTRPDGAEVVLLIGPDVSNEAEVLELTSSSYWQLMCKIDPWFVLFLCHCDIQW